MDNAVSRILAAMKEKGFDQKTFAQQLEIRPQAITEWKKGTTTSYTRYLPQIADLLGTSVDYLLTGSQPTDDPVLSDALAKFRRLTPEQRAAVQMMIDSLAAQNASNSDTEG